MTDRDIKKALGLFRKNTEMINSLQEQIVRLAALAEKTTVSLSKVPGGSSGTGNKIELSIEGIEDAKQKIEELTCENSVLLFETEEIISNASSEIFRKVLRYKYLFDFKEKEIAQMLNYSERHIERLHKKALEQLKMSENVGSLCANMLLREKREAKE